MIIIEFSVTLKLRTPAPITIIKELGELPRKKQLRS